MDLFVSGFLLSTSLCLDLGIVNVALMRVAVLRGVGPAFRVGLGSMLGDLVYAALSLGGLAVALQNRQFRLILWIGGTAVLIGLTIHMIREAFHPKPVDVSEPQEGAPAPGSKGAPNSALEDVAWGMGLALSSPSAILWFATVGGSLIATAGAGRAGAAVPFLAGFALASVLWSFALAAGTRAGSRRLGPRLVQGLAAASALIFSYFATRVFLDGYRTLL